MRLTELLQDGRFHLSCEVFPPKPDAKVGMEEVVRGMAETDPAFLSVTCSTGESDRASSARMAGLAVQTGRPVVAHLTSLGYDSLPESLDRLRSEGIENVLALRGDKYTPGIYAEQMARAIASYRPFRFCIGGACYPEGHPEAGSIARDLDFLRRKVEAGCEFLVTQTVFDNSTIFTFLARLRQIGISVPVVIGIMAPTDAGRLKRMAALSGNVLPPRCRALMERYGENPAAMEQAGLAYAADQIFDLAANGVGCVHLYTLNRIAATRQLLGMVSELRGMKVVG